MAGIGFTLRRMLGKEGLVGPLQAFAYAAVISSGPWLTSSLSLAFLGAFGSLGADSPDTRIFLAIVSYGFAFSLIGVGVVQMVASRYLADRLYEESIADFAPAFVQLLVPLLVIQGAAAAMFMTGVPISPLVRCLAVMFYLALNGTWLALVFLSAAHDYRAITIAFVSGWSVGLVGGLWGGYLAGLPGQMAGFTTGILLCFFLLLGRLDREFGLPIEEAPAVWRYFRDYWPLVLTGLAYNAAIWVDKILFWYHPSTGVEIAGWLRAAPGYDNAMFMAYLTIIPSLALFMMKVETDFYDQYRAYFSTIAAREGLDVLLRVKQRMVDVLRESLGLMIKVQGTLTLFVVLLAPEVTRLLGMDWLSVFVFRAGAFGAFLHSMHLIVLVLLLYFDLRLEAALLACVFLLTNMAFTAFFFAGGLPAWGFGYAVSSAVTLLVGLILLDRNLRDLEYHVFMKQPL